MNTPRISFGKLSLGACLFLCIFLAGCLSSPLLNHADAAATSNISTLTNADCPMFYPKHNLCADLTWIKMPQDNEKGELMVRFFDKDHGKKDAGPFITPQETVNVKLWMPSMGHGSSPVKVAQDKDAQGQLIDGTFRGTEVYFVMPGAWEIWVQLKQDRKVVEEAKLDISVE